MANQLAIFVAIILAAAGITAGVSAALIAGDQGEREDLMPAFTNYADLKSFLSKATQRYWGDYTFGGANGGAPQAAEDNKDGFASPDYSKTNVQVEGVDEADTVKTDGEFIYVVNGDSIEIVKAYPPEDAALVQYINATDLRSKDNESIWFSGIYLLDGQLIVIASVYELTYNTPGVAYAYDYYCWNPTDQRTVLYIFDISVPADPALDQTFSISGTPVTSRMTGHTVYSISDMYIYGYNEDDYTLPEKSAGSDGETVEIKTIHYDPETENPSNYINILALDLEEMEVDSITIIADWSSTIYMSLDSLYLTFQKWTGEVTPMPWVSMATSQYDYTTTIYKITVDNLAMRASARGDVGGMLLNQFSMDEHDGYLRVATTSGWSSPDNSVFVLDGELKVVGSLENLAQTETIQSARFVGDKLYLVTFRRVDPLFVIDLSVPTDPKVVGELKIPGFSSYLHPVDADHILGIGRENSTVKISLFDVSNDADPKVVGSYLIDSDYSSSESSWDYKSILFDAEKELLVIPVSVYSNNWNSSWTGVYVFNVDVDTGITLRGTIEHSDSYWNYIERSLYIGDYLYTISYTTMKINLLVDLSEVGSLTLRAPEYDYYWYDTGVRGI